MATLRTPESEEKYQAYLKTEAHLQSCSLCDKESLHTFAFWKIVENSFPYDKIAETHHLIVSLRHASGKELNAEERGELDTIKEDFINPRYEWIVEPAHVNKSIPSHAHLHLIIGK